MSLFFGLSLSCFADEGIRSRHCRLNLVESSVQNKVANLIQALRAEGASAVSDPDQPRDLAPLWVPANELEHSQEVAADLRRLDASPLISANVSVALIPGSLFTVESALAKELGRLREKVFREVGEGTGAALDYDRNLDPKYFHVIAYETKTGRIIGSYRMGSLEQFENEDHLGYANEEFVFSPQFREALRSSGMEFGRSFTDRTSGRKLADIAFFRIWQRMGSFVADHPKYRFLIGPVSISNIYSSSAKRLMVAFLKRHYSLQSEDGLTAAARGGFGFHETLSNAESKIMEEVSSLADLDYVVHELDGRGIPPLLAIYETLGAKYMAFAVDKAFNTVDGLMVVDLHEMKTNPVRRSHLEKFLGVEGTQRYLEANGIKKGPL